VVIYFLYKAATTTTSAFTSIVGTSFCFHEMPGNTVKCLNNGGEWEDQNSLFPITSTDVVLFKPLFYLSFGLVVLADGMKSGKLYFV
jgi:hypothetical protein